jgi:hypothetical protein
VDLQVSPDCMVRQVNDAIVVMRKNGQLGSSDLPCIIRSRFRSGR